MPSPVRAFVAIVRDGHFEQNEDSCARLEEFLRENPSFLQPELESPIALAVHYRCSVEVLRFLIHKGCGGVDKKLTLQTERDAQTPLCIATRWGRVDIVDTLLKAGANHAKKSGVFSTPPIVYAVQDKKREDTAILECLLRHDPKQVDWTDINGVTALRSAAKYGNVKAVRLLVSRGADPTLADSNGHTALDMCTSGAFFPFSNFHEDVNAVVENRRQIARLLEDEERAYLVHKGYAVQDGLLAKREFQRDMFSILHLSDVLKLRVCRRKRLPCTLYTAQGYRSHPRDTHVVKTDPATLVQEVMHEVWTGMKHDVFKELMGFLRL